MTILGFDTATSATAVALWDEPRGLALEARDDPPAGARPAHTGRLLELIVDVLDRARIGWDGVERIAVGIGPGTFTGLRIGIATARALAQAREIPLVGISTLESLAFGAASAGAGGGAVAPVLDARRGEAFAAAWRMPELDPLVSPRALSPQALAALAAGLRPAPLAVGDGAIKFREVLEPSGASVPEDTSQLHWVNAINHCRLAGDRDASAPDQIRPEYLRLPDAELTRRATRKR
jgi:tRNA threonylcarbamoyladenosine biosynthesis protein TsaB